MTSAIGKRRAAAKADGADAYHRRRAEIAHAASRVFNQLGFQGTTISAVAEELSIDRATLYYYISSKEDLFDEVIREATEENIAEAEAIQKSDLSASEKLQRLIIALMCSYSRHYPLLYIYIRENLNRVPEKRSQWADKMKKYNHDYERALISIIEEGFADGSFESIGPSEVVAYGILGMVGWTNRWYKPSNSPLDAQHIGRVYAEMAVTALQSGSRPNHLRPAGHFVEGHQRGPTRRKLPQSE